MKGKVGFFTALLIFAAGIVLIVLHDKENIMVGVVEFLGAVFIVPGLINVAVSAFSRKAEREEPAHRAAYVWGLVGSVFAICLGIAMLVAPEFFAGVIVYVFAAVLIAAGFYHVMAVSYLARPFVLPVYYYIIPVLTIVAGCVILFAHTVRDATHVVVLITGISFVCSAVNSLLEYVGTHPMRRVDQA